MSRDRHSNTSSSASLSECPLCERTVPQTSAHHLTPKSRGGRTTIDICLDCHGMIHALFPNKQLAQDLSTIDDLKSHPQFRKYLKWIARRPADRRYRAHQSRTTRRRTRK